MKALVCVEPHKFEYRDVTDPVVSKDQVILKIRRVGICGTDLHAFEGTQPFFNYPRILGHELAGEVIEGKDLNGCRPGDLTTFIPYFNCGRCIACRTGNPNCCVQMQVCGVHVDGGMTEYLSVPSYSLLPACGMEADELALVEPLAIGAHGVRRAGVKQGEYVLVIGAGPIGLGTMEFARLAGGKVIAMDVNAQRLTFCKQQLGVEHIVNALEQPMEALKEITDGDMPTVVIDATGSGKAIMNGFQYMAHSGRYVLVGLQLGDITFSHPEFHKREGTLMSSRNATRQDFDLVIDSLKSGDIKATTFITHRTDFNSVGSEFASWLDPASGVIKAMIEM